MSQQLVPYSTDLHPQLRNPLLVAPQELVPSLEELKSTTDELNELKRRAVERARKAAEDLKIIEQEMRRMREIEKGKAKALPHNRIKRESSRTPSLDQDERNLSPSITSTSTGGPSSSVVPIINPSTPVPQKLPPGMAKVKKKRKREDESDAEHDSQRPRKTTPLPLPHKEHHINKSKLGNSSHPKTSVAPDWSRPPTPQKLLPPQPLRIPTLPAGPRKPIEVKEDFSKAKAPQSQVPITTFYTSIEPWLRPIREEDIGWLEYDGDTSGPYIMPELGRHYTEQWEDEDMQIYGGVPSALDFTASRNAAAISNSGAPPNAPLTKWDATTLSDADLATDKGLGPVSERLVSSLLADKDQSAYKTYKELEEAHEAKASTSGSSSNGPPYPKEKVVVPELEQRTLGFVQSWGLIDSEPDFSNSVDDQISIALRQAQRQFREVAATNKARRMRLVELARERLAYQEYVDMRETLDKNILSTYTKLQKKDGPKVNKKKKKGDSSVPGGGSGAGANGINGVNGGPSTVPLPNPASLGLGPNEDGVLAVPDSLRALVETRQGWVEVIGGSYEERERECPGRVKGVPTKSVFEGIDDEVKKILGASAIFLPSKTAESPVDKLG
ncbi:uncharacterized protein FOMMEDRAFT_166470 [Fomitiporia mediterranea MF3/22]|uniref:uncharacterized protein n=1 Tax=Fomitiporia mediterranea (strain MF3/22) TaxID=694068 RepID=UPI0004407C2B|nr:uncharacterized protein FOMMEDRAFT_166470 [Fomitiporia mediterranea MF3/22]EJD06223.1 hypothetical protein FOMMEDRAFT_166470 [Fomitiporia mediterranea MF3/22]